MESYILWHCLSGFFHLAQGFPVFLTQQHNMTEWNSTVDKIAFYCLFIVMNNFPLYGKWFETIISSTTIHVHIPEYQVFLFL